MPDAECLCVRGFDAVLTADPASTFRNPAIKVELAMKRNKARKEITLKEPFGSSSFPRLSLIIELANGRLTLPKTRNGGDSGTMAMSFGTRSQWNTWIGYPVPAGVWF
jgi:hypothetical protein